MDSEALLRTTVKQQPYPLLFATVSGAHLYGFPSVDSDFDLRGVHILPAREVLGLQARQNTIEVSEVVEGSQIDLVTHDAEKFFRLLLRRNGYVLEQLTSPLVVQTSPEHAELRALVPGLVTRHHAHHYLGFARNQWRMFLKEQPGKTKTLLYVYRVLLTGLHLMRTGQVEANLVTLNAERKLPFIEPLIAAKVEGEHIRLHDPHIDGHEREVGRMLDELEAAASGSSLPVASSAGPFRPVGQAAPLHALTLKASRTAATCGGALGRDRHRGM